MTAPVMPFNVAEYLADTEHLNATEHGAYLLLIMHYWQRGGLPDDDRLLARIVRMAPEEWEHCSSNVRAMFDHGWRHERIDDEIAKVKARHERRVSAGRASGNSRRIQAGKNDEQCSSIAQTDEKGGSSSLLTSSSSSILRDSEERRESEDTRARSTPDAKRDDWPDDYRERFWATYPNKVGKPKALAKLDGARKRGVAWNDLWGGLLRYASKTDDRPWCNPETWINQERWTDEPAKNAQPWKSGNGNSRPVRGGFHARLRTLFEDEASGR